MLEPFRQAVLFLLDKSKPFDREKVKILDQISENLYGKDHQMVFPLYTPSPPNFWLFLDRFGESGPE